MFEQTEMMTYWTHLMPPLPGPHMSGKRVIVGHTPQADGQVLDRGHLVCIDTYCFGYGYLTAYEIGGKSIIQANRHGHLKHSPLSMLQNKLLNLGKGCTRWIAALKPTRQGEKPSSSSD
jgi:serine/threonine protein phosphatase 1